MAKFQRENFIRIIQEIEAMEASGENIWIPIGILERMYDNYTDIDDYFHTEPEKRNSDELFSLISSYSY